MESRSGFSLRGVWPFPWGMLTQRVSRFVAGAVVGLYWVACSSEKPLEPPSRAFAPTNEPAATAGSRQPANATSVQGPSAAPAANVAASGAQLQRLEGKAVLDLAERQAWRRSLEHRLSHTVEGLRQHALPDGSLAVDTEDHFQHVVVQVRGEDGKLRTECLENHRQLDALLGTRDRP